YTRGRPPGLSRRHRREPPRKSPPMRHKKDHAEPPIRAIVLALTAVILVTLVVQSLVSHRGVPAALTRYARSDHAQNAANRVPPHLPACGLSARAATDHTRPE